MAKFLLLLLLVVVSAMAEVQGQPATADGPAADEAPSRVSFRPSVPIAVGIFTMVFVLTFLMLMYVKFCHQSSLPPLLPAANRQDRATTAVDAHGDEAEPNGGVGKAVIESLPFFRFAALRGARQGLECAVCLAQFADADMLRLLPRCRHAFHLDCVDRWLRSRASCPLCRANVHSDDAQLKYDSASARFVFGAAGDDDPAAVGSSGSGCDGLLQAGIFVERVPSSRFGGGDNCLDRHRHRIVVSDAVFKSRWSDLNSADLIALNTEMLHCFSSGRFDEGLDHVWVGHPEEDSPMKQEDGQMSSEKKRLLESSTKTVRGASIRWSSGVRSMSEIVRLPRVTTRTEEERRWLPIARRTARWFARREVETAGKASSSSRL
uniref:Uncharacterized protein n=1 Tax=Avena sativa TaxID=4498 RepID=A0ACD6A3X5_AVESA